ncbi:MAG: hypothetical protein ACXWZS_02005 [Gemmatirosa sp.]
MRRLVLASLLAGLAACDGGRSTGPGAAVITVRIREDGGASGGRNQVLIATPSATLSASTSPDGTADVAVATAGSYRVTVIPRDGFVGGIAGLSKVVTVAAGEAAVVEFTVNRASVSPGEPPTEIWGPF